ncbi:LysE family translocator [Salinigranum rubrum]|uniref:LysE family translocator n=1 Tax=Salinigranum rubrum TaxID=755307 RepID=A0A2I8VR14_9EURY|nr:LysE family translocator [Salinigranum rubrum]AUV83599.1 LysE family translocator [Salinigranum rubrum]
MLPVGSLLGFESTLLVAYLAAAVALILAPGPDTMYVLARGLQGPDAGVRSALGVATGVLGHTLAAALGVSALLKTAPTAFTLLKYAGAVYLIYLAAQALRTDEFDPTTESHEGGSFRRGVLVNALNPKVALFFLAFLPGFAGSGPGAPTRMAFLGALYAGVTAVYLSSVALASNRAGQLLARSRLSRGLQYVASAVMVVLAGTLVV